MYVVVKLAYGFIAGYIRKCISNFNIYSNRWSLFTVLVLLAIGGIKKDELLSMPKGNKIYTILKKLKLMK